MSGLKEDPRRPAATRLHPAGGWVATMARMGDRVSYDSRWIAQPRIGGGDGGCRRAPSDANDARVLAPAVDVGTVGRRGRNTAPEQASMFARALRRWYGDMGRCGEGNSRHGIGGCSSTRRFRPTLTSRCDRVRCLGQLGRLSGARWVALVSLFSSDCAERPDHAPFTSVPVPFPTPPHPPR